MNLHIDYQPGNLTFAEFHLVDEECFPHEPIRPEAFPSLLAADFWAAYDGDRVIGYCYMVRRLDMSWLSRMCVSGEYRQRGIASRMMQAAIAQARQVGLPDMVLYVQSDNLPAIGLYERFGFKAVESAYQFVVIAPEQIYSRQPSGSITAVPVTELEPACWPQFPREWANIAEMHRPPEQVVLLFQDLSGKNLGYCRFRPGFPGCFPFVLAQPLVNLLPVLQQLRPYALAGKEALVLTFSDDQLAEACRALGLKMNYQLFKMFRIHNEAVG
jgi:GNAT superfamily N-acetyltransferase